jgi:hypothetical protein
MAFEKQSPCIENKDRVFGGVYELCNNMRSSGQTAQLIGFSAAGFDLSSNIIGEEQGKFGGIARRTGDRKGKNGKEEKQVFT